MRRRPVASDISVQQSPEYTESLQTVSAIWEGIARRLPDDAVMVGTADHGHIDFEPDQRVRLPKDLEQDRTFYGDSRVMFVRGDDSPAFAPMPATWIPAEEVLDWWGPAPRHEAFAERAPDAVLLADDDAVLLHSHSDKRLIGQHGGLTDPEREVPLLVATGRQTRRLAVVT